MQKQNNYFSTETTTATIKKLFFSVRQREPIVFEVVTGKKKGDKSYDYIHLVDALLHLEPLSLK